MTSPKDIIPIPSGINAGLSSAKRSTMLSVLGMPRPTLDDTCRSVTNPAIKSLIVTEDVGPFKVTGLKPAVASLRRVLAKVKDVHPEVYDLLGSSGMLCVRRIKDSSNPSNHSWGCAIDINIQGALDGIKVGGGTGKQDNRTLAGLATMAPFFHKEGWFWGVGFSNFEDGMHFEVADQTIRKWHAEGLLVDSKRKIEPENLSIGDVGGEVKLLQQALIDRGSDLVDDGEFGSITQGYVIDFQAANNLKPDGIVGPKTKAALGLA
ncbi:MAG: M15 family metallopeptidase [Proteobacteria bacterium]|nr:M15 family metallopeptidase [Pseudomonadota bacterium]